MKLKNKSKNKLKNKLKIAIIILLLLFVGLFVVLSACGKPESSSAKNNTKNAVEAIKIAEPEPLEQLAQYNACAEYINTIEQIVRTEVSAYASCFGLGDSPVLLKKDAAFSVRAEADSNTQLKSLDEKMEACYAQIYDANFAQLIVATDERGREFLSILPEISSLVKNSKPTAENFAFKELHQKLMTSLDSYLAAVEDLSALVQAEKDSLNKQELLFSAEHKLILRESIQSFAISCEQALDFLKSGAKSEAAKSIPIAIDQLGNFLKISEDKNQAAKEGYTPDILNNLYLAGEHLTGILSAYLDGTVSLESANAAYADFASYYNASLASVNKDK